MDEEEMEIRFNLRLSFSVPIGHNENYMFGPMGKVFDCKCGTIEMFVIL